VKKAWRPREPTADLEINKSNPPESRDRPIDDLSPKLHIRSIFPFAVRVAVIGMLQQIRILKVVRQELLG